jgi:hypothetical protein
MDDPPTFIGWVSARLDAAGRWIPGCAKTPPSDPTCATAYMPVFDDVLPAILAVYSETVA